MKLLFAIFLVFNSINVFAQNSLNLALGDDIRVSCGSYNRSSSSFISLTSGKDITISCDSSNRETPRRRNEVCRIKAWEIDPSWNSGYRFKLQDNKSLYYGMEEVIYAVTKNVDLESCMALNCRTKHIDPQYNGGNTVYVDAHLSAFRSFESANEFIYQMRRLGLCQ